MKYPDLKLKLALTVCVLCLPVLLFGQKPKVKNDPTHDDKPIHFGFSLGMNTMDYRIEHSQQAIREHVYVGLREVEPGINIHAIANLRLSENMDLRALPGISFGNRYMYFLDLNSDSLLYEGGKYRVESSYLEFPLLVKYKSKRLNNFRPYLIGGANIRYDLAVKKEFDAEEQLIMVSKPDAFLELGYGMDFYLTYFKLGVEIKYSLGLTNILLREDNNGPLPPEYSMYSDWIGKITSHMVILSFHFE